MVSNTLLTVDIKGLTQVVRAWSENMPQLFSDKLESLLQVCEFTNSREEKAEKISVVFLAWIFDIKL